MAYDTITLLDEIFGPGESRRTVNKYRRTVKDVESLSPDERMDYEERAAIKEYCGNIPRPQAQRQAWAEIIEKVA